MGRSKKKVTPFNDYERPTDSQYQVNYTRITHLQLVCMNELTNSAFRLYIMMKDYAKSDTEFTYPHRIFKSIFSKKKIYPADFEEGVEYRIYYEEKTDIIVKVEKLE